MANFTRCGVGPAILSRLLYTFIEDACHPDEFKPFALGPLQNIPAEMHTLMSQLASARMVCVSKCCQTPKGPLRVQDVVQCSEPLILGRIMLVLQTTHAEGNDRFWALLSPFLFVPNEVAWIAEAQPEVVIELSKISAPLCYATVQGRIVV